MGRRKEFKQAAARPRETRGGIRYYARATAGWVEAQPIPQPTVETPSGVYAEPGRGANGESSN